MKLWLAALVVGWPAIALASPGLPQVQLDQGRIAYERGDYTGAVDTIHPLLYPRIELRSEEAVVEAHRLLALSYFFMKKQPEAEEEVSSLLALRPTYKLDPIVDPPVAVSFFDSVRTRQEERLREVQKRQQDEEERLHRQAERRKLAERMVISQRVVIRNSRVIAALPFGIGQWQNRQPRKALFFALSESVSSALSLACYVAINQRFPNAHFAPGDQGLATALTATQLVAGGAFWGLLAWGIIDAEVKFKPEHVLDTRDLPVAPAPLKSSSPGLTIAPVFSFSPSFQGLGLQGAF